MRSQSCAGACSSSEEILVNEAHKAGDTWEVIAEALGESRQAVHRRHGRKADG